MIHAQNCKYVPLFCGTAATNATTTAATVDSKGFDYVTFIVMTEGTANTANGLALFDMREHDTSSTYSDHATISGWVGTSEFTLTGVSDTNLQLYLAQADLRYRKRYLSIGLTPEGTAKISSICAVLSRAEQTTSGQGATVDDAAAAATAAIVLSGD